MFRRISDFSAAWKMESEKTLHVFRALTDASLEQKVTAQGRSLGFIAWHIVSSTAEMLAHAELQAAAASGDQPPTSAAELAGAYEATAQTVAETVPANWKDDMLTGVIPVYGQTWTRAGLLMALIAHQSHHRGQMTVLMRQAGLKVPGVYGPSKEEWERFGSPAHP